MENRLDDILVAPQPLGSRLAAVCPLPDYQLALTFDNREHRIFDAKPLLDYPAFAQLRSEPFFRLVQVQFGTICWPGDIDYCADTLYLQSK